MKLNITNKRRFDTIKVNTDSKSCNNFQKILKIKICRGLFVFHTKKAKVVKFLSLEKNQCPL